MMTKQVQYSEQQRAVFDWVQNGTGSAFVRARAGTGKTTLLTGACRLMSGSIALAAFNKKIADEFKVKLEAAGVSNNQLRSGTFHSFGRSALVRVYPKARCDADGKRDRLLQELKVPDELHSFSYRLMGLSKQAAFGLLASPDDESAWWRIIDHHDMLDDLEEPERMAREGVRWAQRLLQRSKEVCGEVYDFDDMIYMPAVTNMRVWQNQWVLVDEAQDTNPVRRVLARKMLSRGGRSIWVGDDRQAIYGFTGADADAIDVIEKEFSCAIMPLTVTYRCPKVVVSMANEFVPDIRAHETAPSGEYLSISGVDDMIASQDLQPSDAVLCRKTAPLVTLAFRIIKKGTACHVEGRDIGVGLLNLATRWKVKSIDVLRRRLEEYREREVAKLTAKGREEKAAQVDDRVETLFVLMESCDTVDCVKQKIEAMFADDAPTLTLSTVHKAKGREWDRVYVLGRHQYMPSSFARQAWQMVQEENLIYVAYTRSKRVLATVHDDVSVQKSRTAS